MAYPSGFEFTLYSVAACRTTRMSGVIRSNGLTARFRFPSRLAQWILDRLAAPPRQLWVRFADGRGTDKTLPPGGSPRRDMSRTAPYHGDPIWFRLWIDAGGLVRRAEMRAPGLIAIYLDSRLRHSAPRQRREGLGVQGSQSSGQSPPYNHSGDGGDVRRGQRLVAEADELLDFDRGCQAGAF